MADLRTVHPGIRSYASLTTVIASLVCATSCADTPLHDAGSGTDIGAASSRGSSPDLQGDTTQSTTTGSTNTQNTTATSQTSGTESELTGNQDNGNSEETSQSNSESTSADSLESESTEGTEDANSSETGPSCEIDEVLCDRWCIDPLTDHEHCGAHDDCTGQAAGETCPAFHHHCLGGRCVRRECDSPSMAVCSDTCVDGRSDPNKCGARADCKGPNNGVACADGYTCFEETCIDAHGFSREIQVALVERKTDLSPGTIDLDDAGRVYVPYQVDTRLQIAEETSPNHFEHHTVAAGLGGQAFDVEAISHDDGGLSVVWRIKDEGVSPWWRNDRGPSQPWDPQQARQVPSALDTWTLDPSKASSTTKSDDSGRVCMFVAASGDESFVEIRCHTRAESSEPLVITPATDSVELLSVGLAMHRARQVVAWHRSGGQSAWQLVGDEWQALALPTMPGWTDRRLVQGPRGLYLFWITDDGSGPKLWTSHTENSNAWNKPQRILNGGDRIGMDASTIDSDGLPWLAFHQVEGAVQNSYLYQFSPTRPIEPWPTNFTDDFPPPTVDELAFDHEGNAILFASACRQVAPHTTVCSSRFGLYTGSDAGFQDWETRLASPTHPWTRGSNRFGEFAQAGVRTVETIDQPDLARLIIRRNSPARILESSGRRNRTTR